MSDLETRTAGEPMTEKEIDEVSGAGRFVSVFKVEVQCGACGRSSSFLTERPVEFHQDFMSGDYRCSFCGNASHITLSIAVTHDHQVYYAT